MPPTLTSRLRAWTYGRLGLGRAAETPLGSLRAVIAVYSSHPSAPLSLLARTKDLDGPAFKQLEQSRSAVRIYGMRGSAFFAPTDCADRIFSASRVPVEKFNRAIEYNGLTLDEYRSLKPAILEAAQEPAKPGALQKAVRTTGNLTTAVRLMSREGLTLRVGGSLRTDQLSYVASRAWLGYDLGNVDQQEALAWLAGEYLLAYGPARLEDFTWWAGATKTAAKAALAKVKTVDVGGGYLLPEDLSDAFEKGVRLDPEAVDILPKWDSLTMAYGPDGRQRFLDDAYLKLAYTGPGSIGATSGDGLPLVLLGGRAVATWWHRFQGNKMQVSVTPFPGEMLPRGLDHHFAPAASLLSATSLDIRSTV